ncbi:hypothetical protein ACLHDF_25770 [Priestia aryabhattai]|uniref:hypothetical protein n=1 Tax=Priestia megaterium TaxID=1404 RepID=UPI0039B8D642
MKRICFLVFVLFMLYGCQSQDKEPLVFKGKSENWSVEEIVKPNDKGNEESKTIKLKYIGDDMKSVGEFDFKLDTPNGQWGMGIIELDKKGRFKETNKTIVSRETLKSDKPTVTIKWNSNSEDIPLKNQ